MIYEKILKILHEKYGISDYIGIFIHKDRLKRKYKPKIILWFNENLIPILKKNPKYYNIFLILKKYYNILDFFLISELNFH